MYKKKRDQVSRPHFVYNSFNVLSHADLAIRTLILMYSKRHINPQFVGGQWHTVLSIVDS